MQGASRYFMNQRGKEDHALRCKLLAAANGEDREAAIAALHSLRRLYHLRLPLIAARLGLNGHGLDSGVRRNDDGGPNG